MNLKEGIAYNFIDGETIIINPEIDLIICLNEEGTKFWKKLIEGSNDISEDFMGLLSSFKLIEGKYSENLNSEKYVKWTEKFSPVTFGRSCGLLPAQGGPCLGYPFQ